MRIDAARGRPGHLAQLGHTRVAYLAGTTLSWSENERRRALATAETFGMHATVIDCGTTIAAGHHATPTALEHDISAIIANNYIVALGALTRLQELGVAVPDQISLTGFDDMPYARYGKPPLTTVRVPRAVIGQLAGQMLIGLIVGDTDLQAPALQPKLLVRGSTAAPR